MSPELLDHQGEDEHEPTGGPDTYALETLIYEVRTLHFFFNTTITIPPLWQKQLIKETGFMRENFVLTGTRDQHWGLSFLAKGKPRWSNNGFDLSYIMTCSN